MLTQRNPPTMEDSTTPGTADTRLGPVTTVHMASDPEATEEYARLRASLGFIDEAPARVIDGRYEVEEIVGRGAMGAVYRAKDNKLPRFVALKVVRTRPFSDPKTLRHRLACEAEMLARVEHPNVVTIYDIGEHLGDLYLTMQYVAGRTLRSWQLNEQPDREALLDAYLQAARGLAAAHAVGVVHRDFKPENVLRASNGVVHVVDFGIADVLRDSDRDERATLPDRANDSSKGTFSTRTGSLIGTVPYMSPQQLEGVKAEPRDDQFAFCVSLWEAFTGTRPYPGNDLFQILVAMQSGLAPDRRVPRSVRPILMRGLSYRREDRFPSMDRLIAALERARVRGYRRRNAGIATAGVLFAGAVGWLAAGIGPVSETCESFQAQADAIWGSEARRALQDHAELDPEAVAYAIATLDGLREQWEVDAKALCQERLPPPRDSRERRCLEAWLEDLARHVEVLVEHGDARTLALAPELLSNLVSPRGDYCALRPAAGVDPEVWRLARAAREAARMGDTARALTLADRANEYANEVASEHEYSRERAEAQAARAEVLARSGQIEPALAELGAAEKQALGAEYSHGTLEIWVLMAKLSAFRVGDESAIAAGWQHVERARPLAGALRLDELHPLRGELDEACGRVERARGEHERAIACHERAAELFAAIGRVPLVARAHNNIGANAMKLGDAARAAVAFQQSLAELDAAGVPPSYPTRIEAEFNLGLLALERGDQEGLPRFEFVVDHGMPDQQLEAKILAAQLLVEGAAGGQLDEAMEWAEAALTELEARSDEVDAALAVKVQAIAGLILAEHGDPFGEDLLGHAAEAIEVMGPEFVLGLERSWIELLLRQGRCDEAAERLARVEAWSRSVGLEAQMVDWRDSWQASLCRHAAV